MSERPARGRRRNLQLDYQLACAQPELAPTRAQARAWVSAALDQQPAAAELALRVVDEEEARALNRQYRGKDYATNVLSFPAELPGVVDLPLLGDIVICAPVVRAEAAQQGKAVMAHWAHMVVHGTLHLLGHDHQDDEQAVEMEQRERDILSHLGFPDPYEQAGG